MELRTKARRLQAERGLDLLIVDYLQLMQATTNSRDANRVQEVSEISRGSSPWPASSRCRSSPYPAVASAGDARVARAAPQRPARVRRHRAGRGPGALPVAGEGQAGEEAESDGEVVNLRLAKHRNGPTGEVKLWFKKSQTRFLSYAAERYAEAV